jgi:poly(3-hydroxybutyrate) depolymerase
VPPERHGKALPLVAMLHGCTQHPDDFAAGTDMNEAACEQGFYVLYPAAVSEDEPPALLELAQAHQRRGRGKAALLAGMTRAVIKEHGLSTRSACT